MSFSPIYKIILLGPKHVGKTTVGKRIARSLSIPFYDSDAEILLTLQKKNKIYKNIGTAYKNLGIALFKKYEATVVKQILKLPTYILATGGGVADNKEAFFLIQSQIHQKTEQTKCIAIALKDNVEKIWERIRKKQIPAFVKDFVHTQLSSTTKQDRTTLQKAYTDYFIKTFKQRDNVYTTVATIVFTASNKSSIQLAKEICAIL